MHKINDNDTHTAAWQLKTCRVSKATNKMVLKIQPDLQKPIKMVQVQSNL